MFIQLRYAIGLFLLFFVTTIWAEVAVPPLSHRVTDLTATLNAEQNTALENKIAAFEARKGSQIAVLILPTTQGEDIAAYGIRVADTWKIGRKAIDDGVILIVAKDDRKLRIEVGRGLEGAIPDAIAKRIIAEIITPKFKANDFSGGIDAGVSQLIKLIDGEPLPVPTAEDVANASQNTSQDNSFDWIIGIALFAFMMLDMFFAELFGAFLGTVCTGVAAGVIGSGFSFFSSANIGEAVIAGIGMFVVGVIASCIFKVYSIFSGSSGGSWSSSGGSSWGGGGGGFSGGGASGSW